jgi:phosphoglycolate phosphatase
MNYQLLVFDWDGTLMDSAARIVASLTAGLRRHRRSTRRRGALSRYHRPGSGEAMQRLCPECQRDAQRGA